MATFESPAWKAFAAQLGEEFIFAQVLVRRAGVSFKLRHVADRETAATALRLLALTELRPLAQFTATGAFRPLKAAPNLASGWRLVTTEAELEVALSQLYPGAVADWFAARALQPPVTSYRDFTTRQSGMYRITTMLTDAQAAQVTRGCCHATLCLKRRLWSVPGMEPDRLDGKSLIPCLEPCAVLLECARKAVRKEQEEKAISAAQLNEAFQRGTPAA